MMKLNIRQTLRQFTSAAFLAAATTHGALVPITTDIAADTTVTWYATNEYRLDTMIYVQTNATLVIEPGTVVYGATNVAVARPGLPELVSGLWVTRGGKLYATGTVTKPIIFTAEGDDLNGKYKATDTALWGGVVIMGNATINSAKFGAGQAATPKYDRYEGVTGNGDNNEHLFGGSDDEDSSGALRYVSIRHCGRIFNVDAELNCLTMGGVGRGTLLEYVEVFAGSDDGFEWWGGTVNSKHLVAAFIEDDDFDTDQGYRGTNQFWFGIKLKNGGVTSGGRGFETDGDVNPGNGTATPYSQWSAYNVTLIGRGKDVTTTAEGVAWFLEDGSAPSVHNSIFSDWNLGFQIQADGVYHFTNAPVRAFVQNNIWDVNTGGNANAAALFSTTEFSNSVQSAMLGGVSYTNDFGLDPRPQAGSPAFDDVQAGAPMPVSYRGAFSGPSDAWADGWSGLSQLGYLAPAAAAPVNTAPVLTAPAPNSEIVINVGVNLSVTNTATDSDVPAQTLTFSLLSGLGLITPEGVFTWRPQVGSSDTTNVVTVKVSDDGTPSLSATNMFSIIVNPLMQPTLGSVSYSGGQFSLTVDGQTGPDYMVQVSTNLAMTNWVTVLLTNSPALPFTFSETPDTGEPMKFYRVLVGPPTP
jgi:hypothetical protein